MCRTESLLATACLLLAGCAPVDRSVTMTVGETRLRLEPPRGWEHVDNGGRHEFRTGDQRMSLVDEGAATPEALAISLGEVRELLRTGREREAIQRLAEQDPPVLAAGDRRARDSFWRDWNSVAYDPTRRTAYDLAPALERLVERANQLPELDAQAFARWVVAKELDTLRYQIQGVEPASGPGSSWWVARTWSRVAHMHPRRFAVCSVEGRLLVLDSGSYMPPHGEQAFEALLASIAPVPDDPR